MRLLRVLVLTACVFALLPLFAQTSQSQNSPASGAAQASPAQESSQEPSTGFIRTPFVQQPLILAQRRHPNRTVLPQTPVIPGDPGIYAKGLSNFCGTIISYNFSQGDNPHLENVTTCTPSKGVTTRYAQGDQSKPPTPALVQTKLVQAK